MKPNASWVGKTLVGAQTVEISSDLYGGRIAKAKGVSGVVGAVGKKTVGIKTGTGDMDWYELDYCRIGGLRVIEVIGADE